MHTCTFRKLDSCFAIMSHAPVSLTKSQRDQSKIYWNTIQARKTFSCNSIWSVTLLDGVLWGSEQHVKPLSEKHKVMVQGIGKLLRRKLLPRHSQVRSHLRGFLRFMIVLVPGNSVHSTQHRGDPFHASTLISSLQCAQRNGVLPALVPFFAEEVASLCLVRRMSKLLLLEVERADCNRRPRGSNYKESCLDLRSAWLSEDGEGNALNMCMLYSELGRVLRCIIQSWGCRSGLDIVAARLACLLSSDRVAGTGECLEAGPTQAGTVL
jgi:hypothetical protein